MNDLRDGGQVQRLGDLVHHILRCTEHEDAVRLHAVDGRAHLLRVARQHEDGAPHRHDAALFLFRRMPANDLAILDEDAVVDDSVRLVLVSDEQRAVALARTARPDECDDVHRDFSPYSLRLTRGISLLTSPVGKTARHSDPRW